MLSTRSEIENLSAVLMLLTKSVPRTSFHVTVTNDGQDLFIIFTHHTMNKYE